ncbi:serine/threonine-protein kinase [Streptomyces sp. NPDC005236]|uniref:serine/threonine-protein kinase n=1 Tax=Streptomyces sp. NPDC005236 TaxID=3157028 RepID=UPI0033A9326B
MTGRYRLVESIGQGGMGRVWRAADEMLDRQVAVKEMRMDGPDPEDTRTRRERILREARATARIDHPGVVRVYDVVDAGERLWIVMELVAGRSLERIVAEGGPLEEREAARVGLELVGALRQVHAQGVLHRDIKPGNVLVEGAGRNRVVLTDFGIAALQDAEALTMAGLIVGSPDYMAPERISGRPQGPPSDVWSLGATLCAALGGRSPFSRSTTLATLHAVLHEEPELPSGAGELRGILSAVLKKDPAARPALEELEAAFAELVPPPRTSPPGPAGPRAGGPPTYDSAAGNHAVARGPAPSTTANASTEIPSGPRTEPGSGAPARLPVPRVPPPVVRAPDEPSGPAVPPGFAGARGHDPSRARARRPVGAAAAGVVVAGAVVWAVVALTGGPPGGAGSSTGSSPGSSTSTASGAGGRASPASTVEGTSRPPALPPGAHREAGGYAWVTPKGWRRDPQTGSEVHYTSPDGAQELVAKSSLAKGNLLDTWTVSERNARQGRDYRKIRLEQTTFRGRTAVVWEYTFTLKGVSWHARLLGFDADGKSYQINTWYHQDIEDRALTVYDRVEKSFTVL